MKCPPRRPPGYSLLELMIALAVAAVLAAVALPSMSRFADRLKAETLRLQLHTLFNQTRHTAISRNERTEICPSQDGVWCGVDWSRGWLVYPVRVKRLDRDKPPKYVFLVERRPPSRIHAYITEGRTHLQMRPDGRNAGSNLTVRICIEKQLHSVIKVSVPGRVRSWKVRHYEYCGS